MRTLAIGFAAALSLAATAPVNAQGFWVGGPGFGVGVGGGPAYAYDAYPSYGYTSAGYWGEPGWGWGGAYAYQPVMEPYPVIADSFAYAPPVTVGYGYEPAYRYRYSTGRYAYPERVTYRRSYAYSPGYRYSTLGYASPERVRYQRSYAYSPPHNRLGYESDRRARQHVVAGSRIGTGTERVSSQASSERVSVRGSRAMARGSRQEIEPAGGKRDLR
jgi:hypothetical protein